MKRTFFIVGPTATGKSELAADVAAKTGAEIVSADAFQIYKGLDLLTAKPDAATLARAPHHLVGTIPLTEEMNAEKFRTLALQALEQIHARSKPAIVVGGSGLYIKALTHGLSPAPASDPQLRVQLNDLSLEQLCARLHELDPETAGRIDLKNRRRVARALEICLLSGKPASAQRTQWNTSPAVGVFMFRDRDELYARIDRRVEMMFENGVLDEVRRVGEISATASKTIGWNEIQQWRRGEISQGQCIARLQQATRRYAKRQLTWFRGQTSFESLNLSYLSHGEAVTGIAQRAFRSFAQMG